jgi:multicomponent Na+:H+ antiporter subunit B
MLMGIFSLLSASLFTVMDAVDVAFTEAAVGAGVSTILMLATLSMTNRTESDKYKRGQPLALMLATLSMTNRTESDKYKRGQPLALVVVILTGAALVYATFDMPRYGDPAAPIHHHVADDYIERTHDEIGVPNMVTAVLASYRGYDTWGETTVIFTACVGVMLLLGGAKTYYRWRHKDDVEGGGTR